MSTSLLRVTPMIPTGTRLPEALTFYTDHMGFSEVWRAGDMAGVERDGVSFNLAESSNLEWAQNASFSIAVSDLDALYHEYRDIPARIGALEMKSWGRREFHMIVPSGVCLQFYELSGD